MLVPDNKCLIFLNEDGKETGSDKFLYFREYNFVHTVDAKIRGELAG